MHAAAVAPHPAYLPPTPSALLPPPPWPPPQAGSNVAGNVDAVKALTTHPSVALTNPNTCYSLFLGFARSPVNFHAGGWVGWWVGVWVGSIECEPHSAKQATEWAAQEAWSQCQAWHPTGRASRLGVEPTLLPLTTRPLLAARCLVDCSGWQRVPVLGRLGAAGGQDQPPSESFETLLVGNCAMPAAGELRVRGRNTACGGAQGAVPRRGSAALPPDYAACSSAASPPPAPPPTGGLPHRHCFHHL